MTLHQNGVPLYHQLKEIFLEKIMGSEWKAEEMIPPEPDLCSQYGVSRGPVRQALAALVREGILVRKQGKGTWVLPPKIERSLGGFYSFTDLIKQKGLTAASKLLSVSQVQATPGVARSLKASPEDSLIKITRLRFANDEPLILETLYIPLRICPDLKAEDVENSSLYDLFQQKYHIPLAKAIQCFEPVVTDEYESEVLHVKKGAPALLIQNVTFAQGGIPILLSKAIIRGDRVRFYVDLPAPEIKF